MTVEPTVLRHEGVHSVETPSGKWRGAENFPVGSFLIRRDLRPHVLAFYRFARNADDIADNPALSADEKIRRLDRMAAILDGAPGNGSLSAEAMRQSLAETRMTGQHCHDVLRAFRLDATKLRYIDWDDLMAYCRYSASPVGRQLLDLHGESRETWAASDALCSALQVLNHLQDCGDDDRRLDRVYLPIGDLAAEGIGVEALAARASCPGLRRVIDGMLDRTDALVEIARGLPAHTPGARRENPPRPAGSNRLVRAATRKCRNCRAGGPAAAPAAARRSVGSS